MNFLEKLKYSKYIVYCPTLTRSELPVLINEFLRADNIEKKGRAGIRILKMNGRLTACRKYVHGGLFRAITRDIFFSGKRAINELEIMLYLKRAGFSIVEPYCAIIEKHLMLKTPYILTVFEENAKDLMEVLNNTTQKERLRIIKRLARLMWHMETLGVYHPDLHLNNVLVTAEGTMKFLDFDRACRKPMDKKDMEKMLWRLNRYVEKMERTGRLKIDVKEKILFLRTYRRVSGFDILPQMESKISRKAFISRAGWFFNALFYGKVKTD